VPIGEYFHSPPKGMNKKAYEAMKQSYRDTVALLGSKIAKPLVK